MVGNILILETAFLWSFLGIATKMVTYHGMTVTAVISLVAMLTLRVCNRGVCDSVESSDSVDSVGYSRSDHMFFPCKQIYNSCKYNRVTVLFAHFCIVLL